MANLTKDQLITIKNEIEMAEKFNEEELQPIMWEALDRYIGKYIPAFGSDWDIRLNEVYPIIQNNLPSTFFRNPRAFFKPRHKTYIAKRRNIQSGRMEDVVLDSSKSAKTQEQILNYLLTQIGYKKETRKVLLDALLFPYAILWHGYKGDFGMTEEQSITIENDRDGGIPQYFIRKGEAQRLMGPPITTLEKIMPGSKTSRRAYGHSMASVRHKQIGEDLLYEWLDLRGTKKTYYDTESGEKTIELGTRNIDRLEDQLLIDQLINYERGGNYDLVMAMMGIVVQLKEWYDPEESNDWEENDISDQLKNWKLKRYGTYEDKMKHINRKFKI